jgi:hypothetical protein
VVYPAIGSARIGGGDNSTELRYDEGTFGGDRDETTARPSDRHGWEEGRRVTICQRGGGSTLGPTSSCRCRVAAGRAVPGGGSVTVSNVDGDLSRSFAQRAGDGVRNKKAAERRLSSCRAA